MFGTSDVTDYQGFLKPNNFYAMFDIFFFTFTKISTLEQTVEYDTIPEGGLNGRIHIVPKSNSQIATAVFEKAVHKNDAMSYDILVSVGASFEVVSVFVTNGSFPQKLYVLQDCFVTKKSVGELNALSSELLISRMELAYSNMVIFPITL